MAATGGGGVGVGGVGATSDVTGGVVWWRDSSLPMVFMSDDEIDDDADNDDDDDDEDGDDEISSEPSDGMAVIFVVDDGDNGVGSGGCGGCDGKVDVIGGTNVLVLIALAIKVFASSA